MTAPILLAAIFSYAAFLISACAADPETPQTSATPAPSPTEAEISDTAARLELAKVLTYDKRYKEAQVLLRSAESQDLRRRPRSEKPRRRI